jgi:nitrate reductase NapAB chaperone NapD
MSILGVVIRVSRERLDEVKQRLMRVPGVDLAADAGDGRLAATIESTAQTPAAGVMADLAQWPDILNLSLVFEHSGGDPDGASPGASPGADAADAAGFDYRAWRGPVGDFARRQAGQTLFSTSPESTSAAAGAGETR